MSWAIPPVLCSACKRSYALHDADVLRHPSSQRIVRYKLIESHVEALRSQRRLLQRHVCVRCKEDEATEKETEEKGIKKDGISSSIGFGSDASLDEWGAHAEPDKPASVSRNVYVKLR